MLTGIEKKIKISQTGEGVLSRYGHHSSVGINIALQKASLAVNPRRNGFRKAHENLI